MNPSDNPLGERRKRAHDVLDAVLENVLEAAQAGDEATLAAYRELLGDRKRLNELARQLKD